MGSSNEFRSITIPDLHFMHAIFFLIFQGFIRYVLKDFELGQKYAQHAQEASCKADAGCHSIRGS